MKWIRHIGIGLAGLIILLFIALAIYSSTSYKPLQGMNDAVNTIDYSDVTVTETKDHIFFTSGFATKHILFIPGGLVEPHSYDYLMYTLALSGYDITVFKPFFNLAILTPNYAKKFLSDDQENIIMGHSLGGVVASMIASGNDDITTVILMGSYPIRDISDKDTLIITAEFDINMDQEAFQDSLQYVNSNTVFYEIDGGNHAQFGWYGPQKGDGSATISTLEQQQLVHARIVDFLNS